MAAQLGGSRGPYLPQIDLILRNKASSMSSPVISASYPGNTSTIKGINSVFDIRCQLSDIILNIDKDLQLFIELYDVRLRLLGLHQLQNVATATCAALCLHYQGSLSHCTQIQYQEWRWKYGWRISNVSIRTGLESTQLLGRSQFLTSVEAEALGLPGATILLDRAYTKDSAKALVDMIQLTYPDAKLVFVVAMASDKDHETFARELLAVKQQVYAIFLAEVSITGEQYRTASLSLLRGYWIQASNELGIKLFSEHGGVEENQSAAQTTLLFSSHCRLVLESMRMGDILLKSKPTHPQGLIVVTESLHIVSLVLRSI